MTTLNKYLITSGVLMIIFLILVVLIFTVPTNRKNKIEEFDDFKKHQKILNDFIKQKTSHSNLSTIPILNGVNPNDEIEKKSSSFTPAEDAHDEGNQTASVNLKRINENNKKIKNQNKLKNNIIVNKSIAENSCKYISSYNSKPDCPANYNMYSGASMGIGDGQLSCNGQMISNQRAEARATIEDGSIKKISITEPGGNYQRKPTIAIIGDGKLATANCTLKNGKVSKILITNPGKNYTYPPKIEFSKPDGMIYCHLCCQDLNSMY